jgi:hypothetical protein
MRRLTGVLLFAAAAVCALAGCTSDEPAIAALAAQRADGDVLPARVYTQGIDTGSTRFAARKNGYAFYLGQPSGPRMPDGVCVAIINLQDPAADTTACGAVARDERTGFIAETHGVRALVISDGYDASRRLAHGWQQVHKNLLVSGL